MLVISRVGPKASWALIFFTKTGCFLPEELLAIFQAPPRNKSSFCPLCSHHMHNTYFLEPWRARLGCTGWDWAGHTCDEGDGLVPAPAAAWPSLPSSLMTLRSPWMCLWSAGMGHCSGRDNFGFPLVYSFRERVVLSSAAAHDASCSHSCFPSVLSLWENFFQLLFAQRQQTLADVLPKLLPYADGYFGAVACWVHVIIAFPSGLWGQEMQLACPAYFLSYILKIAILLGTPRSH